MSNVEKILNLYKYVKEICALKYTVVTDIDNQHWTCFLKDIPNDSENITVNYHDNFDEETSDNKVLLEVKKPEFLRCPDPPSIIVKWLEPGWDKFTNTPTLKKTLVKLNGVSNDGEHPRQYIEHFENSVKRVQAYEKWIALREKWAEKQRIINETRRFFTSLYHAYTDLERESETLEFMIGNGVIFDLNNRSICHPVLLKRVKFDFNSKENIIRISDTDTDPELYTLLLQEMTDINYGVVRNLADELRDNLYHPLDRNDTPDFLKSLTHRLCSESKFIINENGQPGNGDKIVIRWCPVYFIRKRIDGTLKAIDEIIENIEKNGYVPGHLKELVDSGTIDLPNDNHEFSIDEQLAALNGENIDILLSKEANREQLEIAERIEQYNAVLVQGPPGTGKTHTIANLLGHFLAQGKSVLITSQTKKALSVLKSQIPEEIQNLCVSTLDDTNTDMVRSIDGITAYLSKYTSNELKGIIAITAKERENIIKRLAEVRRKIYTIKYREFESIVYNGESFLPAKAAEFVNQYADKLSYIPGKVRLHCSLPVSIDELHILYQSNANITQNDEIELDCDIPNPQSLVSPATYLADLQKEDEYICELNKIGEALSLVFRCDYANCSLIAEKETKKFILAQNPTEQALDELTKYVDSFSTIERWMIQAAVDGYKGGGYRQRWEMLICSIEDTASCAKSTVNFLVGKVVSFKDGINLSHLKTHLIKLSAIFKKKGKISKIDLLLNKSLKETLSFVSINGSEISSYDDCNIALKYIEFLEKRSNTELIWDELMAKYGLRSFAMLGDEPEENCKQILPNIRRYLDWYQNDFAQFRNLMNKSGLNTDNIFTFSDLDSVLTRTNKILKSLKDIVPLYIQASKLFIKIKEIEQRRQHTIAVLSECNRKNSKVCLEAILGLRKKDAIRYEEEYRILSQLYEKYTLHTKRKEILAKLKTVAPDWAAAIRAREGIHGEAVCPDTIEQAWKWKQFAGIIEEITSEPYEELQNEAMNLSKKLLAKTAKLAAHKAWYNLLLRTERNLETRHALVGWKQTVKRIGKGTGKNAPALRKQARKLMEKCQVAVPAWIMPISKALESFNPSQNSFDVVIVDEASQADITALAILYLAKKVIIVGDDKQVSPMAIGLDIERINALQEMYIKNTFDTWHLYDAKTSLYDIAATTYHPLMLREHFRCVPEIIGYSNKLSYDFNIMPLRDASNCVIVPPVVSYRVADGKREGYRKINVPEAKAVVALIKACIEQPEYEFKTFGVISLLGDEQARLIQEIISKKIELNIIEERHILCGNASHFQGDERNVIFLSMVDSNEGDGPLRFTGDGVDQSTKQRYNVAASRARDQLWVVHSLDYSKDLKEGDIRRDLLTYCENPQAVLSSVEIIKAKAESSFEEAVGKSLVAAGYHITPQWKVGSYRIDMVVQYNGKKIAIECDGDQYHSGEEKVRSDMERQTILERLGWRFIRIRGSEYYRDPEGTMAHVIKELNNNGIFPKNDIEPVSNINTDLLLRVKNRAMQILDEWHNNDDASSYMSSIDSNKKEKSTVISKYPLALGQQKKDKFNESIVSDVKQKTNNSGTNLANNTNHLVASKIKKSGKSNEQKKNKKRGGDILDRLKRENIPYIDRIEQSGIIWVPYSLDIIDNFESITTSNDYKVSFEPRGSLSTGNKPAWRIMVR